MTEALEMELCFRSKVFNNGTEDDTNKPPLYVSHKIGLGESFMIGSTGLLALLHVFCRWRQKPTNQSNRHIRNVPFSDGKAKQLRTQVNLKSRRILTSSLQCHLDKVDQSDYRK